MSSTGGQVFYSSRTISKVSSRPGGTGEEFRTPHGNGQRARLTLNKTTVASGFPRIWVSLPTGPADVAPGGALGASGYFELIQPQSRLLLKRNSNAF